jgi:hypothetical protein
MKTRTKSEPKKRSPSLKVPEMTPEAGALLEWLLELGIVTITDKGRALFDAVEAESRFRRLSKASR